MRMITMTVTLIHIAMQTFFYNHKQYSHIYTAQVVGYSLQWINLKQTNFMINSEQETDQANESKLPCCLGMTTVNLRLINSFLRERLMD